MKTPLLPVSLLASSLFASVSPAQTIEVAFSGTSRLLNHHLLYASPGAAALQIRDLASGQTTQVSLSLGLSPKMFADPAGRFALFLVEESGGDLNGDGDSADLVLHSFDSDSAVVANLGIAVDTNPGIWFDGVRALTAVRESDQGKDLDGDGDQLDVVLHAIHLPSYHVVNTGFTQAVLPSLSFRDRVIAGTAFETTADIDGDGVLFELVPFVMDARFLVVVPVLGPPPAGALVLGDGFAAYPTHEASSSVDYNGDGDLGDVVPVLVDPTTGATTPLAFASSNVPMFAVEGRLVFFSSEADQGADENGDGDLADVVTHLLDPATLARQAIGVTLTPSAAPGQSHYDDGVHLVIGVLEEGAGADLNDDGDAADLVLHAVDLAGLMVRNLKIAVPSVDYWPTQIAGGRIVTLAPEASNGRDLNGDGDTVDQVAVLIDLSVNATLPISAVGSQPAAGLEEELVHCLLDEAEFGVDYNGDGDLLDRVHHAFDYSSGELINLAVAGSYPATTLFELYSPLPTSGSFVIASVLEEQQGGLDLDGDGSGAGKVSVLIRVQDPVCGAVYPFGAGCAGLQGVPALGVAGCPKVGTSVTMSLSGGVPGGLAMLLIGGARAIDPAGPCPLLIADVLPSPQTLPLDGSGAFSVSATLPAATSLPPVTAQAFTIDGSAAAGYAASHGVQVNVLTP